jgi:hypothetical protein
MLGEVSGKAMGGPVPCVCRRQGEKEERLPRAAEPAKAESSIYG